MPKKNTVIGTNFIELFSTLEVERIINIQKGPFKKLRGTIKGRGPRGMSTNCHADFFVF